MSKTAGLGDDFRVRVASGVVMAGVTLGATWLGGWIFTLLWMVLAGVCSWEWDRLTREGTGGAVFLAAAAAAVTAVALAGAGMAFVALVVTGAGAAGAAVLAREHNRGEAFFGVAYVALPMLALVWLRGLPGQGLAIVLFLYAIVWGTDIFAYVFGRLLGGPRLWPAVSPKKTLSGAIGGLAAALVAGLGFAFGVLEGGGIWLVIAALGLGVLSQAGDLFESWVKRAHGVKDASDLIPGHGGVLDRIDGLLFVAVGAAAGMAWAAGAA